MGKEIDLLFKYPKAKRDLSKRLESKSEQIRSIARKFDKEFFDGEREFGYGGFSYNPKYWTEVVKDFKVFLQSQNAPYVIYESALLFEKGGKKYCDEVVLVTAPTALKIERIQKRDQASEDEILARMNNQMTDSEKIPLADHVLENTTLESLQKQVMSLHQLFVKAP